jgi:hypothetical protein
LTGQFDTSEELIKGVSLVLNASNPLGSNSKYVTFIVQSVPPIWITPPNLAAHVDSRIDIALEVTGHPCTALVLASGYLPAGVKLTGQGCNKRLEGAPTTLGIAEFELIAYSANKPTSQHFTFTTTGDAPQIGLQGDSIPDLIIHQAVDLNLEVTGDPYPQVQIKDGDLPNGLELKLENSPADLYSGGDDDESAQYWHITGTPTTLGKYPVTLIAASSATDASAELTLNLHVVAVKADFKLPPRIEVYHLEPLYLPLELTGDPCPALKANMITGLAITGTSCYLPDPGADNSHQMALQGNLADIGEQNLRIEASNSAEIPPVVKESTLVVHGNKPQFLSDNYWRSSTQMPLSKTVFVTGSPKPELRLAEGVHLPEGLSLTTLEASKDQSAQSKDGGADNPGEVTPFNSITNSTALHINGTARTPGIYRIKFVANNLEGETTFDLVLNVVDVKPRPADPPKPCAYNEALDASSPDCKPTIAPVNPTESSPPTAPVNPPTNKPATPSDNTSASDAPSADITADENNHGSKVDGSGKPLDTPEQHLDKTPGQQDLGSNTASAINSEFDNIYLPYMFMILQILLGLLMILAGSIALRRAVRLKAERNEEMM